MADPIRKVVSAILSWSWRQIQHIASFLATLFILAAAVTLILYLMRIKPYVVTTGSMEPAIPVYSICFVNENIPLAEIGTGEVISFRVGTDMLVTHRVTAIEGGSYITKGDANNAEDAAPVTADNYIGKTVLVLPKIGVAMIFLHSGAGRIAAASLITLLLILSFLPQNDKQKKQSDPKPPAGGEGTK